MDHHLRGGSQSRKGAPTGMYLRRHALHRLKKKELIVKMEGDEESEGLRLTDGVIIRDSAGGVRGWSDFTGKSETGFPP